MFNSPGVWDEPHSSRPTEPRLFKIAHFASDLVELMTATSRPESFCENWNRREREEGQTAAIKWRRDHI
jgi:hypothetical protein